MNARIYMEMDKKVPVNRGISRFYEVADNLIGNLDDMLSIYIYEIPLHIRLKSTTTYLNGEGTIPVL